MKHAFFIAGTDTDVGKTYVSTQLLMSASAAGLRARALKPIAAGAILNEVSNGTQWQNEDALLMAQVANCDQRYEQINPFCLPDAISPHIAARRAGQHLHLETIVSACASQLALEHDLAVVEGAGGWRVPINDTQSMADVAKALGLPVILVVGMRLGCINHSLLTAQAIMADGLSLCGWVANQCSPHMAAYEENIATLTAALPCPLLAHLPFTTTLASPSTAVDILKILKTAKC